jgi:hypothetical protein
VTLTRTHTKTFVLYDAWAQTFPWDCLIRDTGCVSPDHRHSPMTGDTCAEPQCDEPLRSGEVCYAVTELPREHGQRSEPWVCWRHIHPDDGPVRVGPPAQ